MILDHIENIRIDQDQEAPIQNYQSIIHIKHGIEYCYHQFCELQSNFLELILDEEPDITSERRNVLKLFTSRPFVMGKAASTAVNLYIWYANNLISYAKVTALVHLINSEQLYPEAIFQDKSLPKRSQEFQIEYVNSIPELKPVKLFRDKFGAHLAYAMPSLKYDNIATIAESFKVMPSLINGKVNIGSMQWKRGEHESAFGSNEWNLADNFESLKVRYFKEDIDYKKSLVMGKGWI